MRAFSLIEHISESYLWSLLKDVSAHSLPFIQVLLIDQEDKEKCPFQQQHPRSQATISHTILILLMLLEGIEDSPMCQMQFRESYPQHLDGGLSLSKKLLHKQKVFVGSI